MSNYLKTAAFGVFRRATIPYRLWCAHAARQQRQTPLMMLYYHRVADRDPTAWSMTNRQFRRQIDWLEQNFDMVSMDELRRRMDNGNSRPAMHITFDDGYAENCDEALPLLIERKIPCTYFVTLDHTSNQRPFEHDAKAGYDFPVNTIDELKDLAGQGIEIGAHTRTHPNLGEVYNFADIYGEIVLARRELAELLKLPIRYFAFPYGLKTNLNHAAAAMARADGVEAVVSAYGGYNKPGQDSFHLQRCHGDPELERIRNAVTFDPRHVRKEKYKLETQGPAVQAALDYYQDRSIGSNEATPAAPINCLPTTTPLQQPS
ncbi:polysaccharide deacetylase family protein [Planctomycetes bacterium K23_9]|uniref:Polysaccharide deacetylase n=1 Tax=Stieleria marina TaxID=1930275 RepID=A0A517NR39_9BACT|nr:Polysaccharide deacetylase [Planctomycetes bacterium K23_9]